MPPRWPSRTSRNSNMESIGYLSFQMKANTFCFYFRQKGNFCQRNSICVIDVLFCQDVLIMPGYHSHTWVLIGSLEWLVDAN